MNFTAVRGFNAYSQFSAKIREAVKNREELPIEPEEDSEYSRFLYSEPVDTVTISKPARNASAALMVISAANPEAKPDAKPDAARENQSALSAPHERTPYTQFREWLRTAGIGGASSIMSGSFTHKVPGSIMNDALRGSGLSVENDEEYSIEVDMLSSVTVSSRNAEKAKAIQDLLISTPAGINWGLLLATLPPR